VKEVDVYVAAHHGHKSGFSTDLFNAMGRPPILNVISVQGRDEHVDDRYSKPEYAIGIGPDDDKRRRVTTRWDGSVFIDVGADGKFYLDTIRLPGNRKKARNT